MKRVCQIGSMSVRVNHPVTGEPLLAPVRISDISDELGPTFIVEPMLLMRVGRSNGKAYVGTPIMGVPV